MAVPCYCSTSFSLLVSNSLDYLGSSIPQPPGTHWPIVSFPGVCVGSLAPKSNDQLQFIQEFFKVWKWKLVIHVWLFATLWTVACSWNSPGRNTGMSSHSLLQDTFQIQGLKPGPPHCSQTLYHLSQQGGVRKIHIYFGEGYKCYFCFFCFPYYWNLAKQTNKQKNPTLSKIQSGLLNFSLIPYFMAKSRKAKTTFKLFCS